MRNICCPTKRQRVDRRGPAGLGWLARRGIAIGIWAGWAAAATAQTPVVSENTTPAGLTTVYQYTTTTFTASFTGSAPITNQWEVSVNNGATFTPIPGQTNTSLTLTNLTLATNEYELVAGNSFGSATSTPATLAVIARAPLQVAGDLIVDLTAADLANGAAATWTNRAITRFPWAAFRKPTEAF